MTYRWDESEFRFYNEDAEREKETVEIITVSQALSCLIRFLWTESCKRKEKS